MESRERVQDLLTALAHAYERRAWHGPNLKGSLRGVGPRLAGWRPQPSRHNIWEIVVHAAYWKYVVRRRLTGEKRSSFPLKGSNWFDRPPDATVTAWKADLALLDDQHAQLLGAVGRLSDRQLAETMQKGVDALQLVLGVVFHDVYHAGQIRLLRRLHERRSP